MKMVRAVIRPEVEEKVLDEMEHEGFVAYTRLNVMGRGRQKGVVKGGMHFLDSSKTLLLIVVEDEECDRLVQLLRKAGRTGKMGDGRIFVTPVEKAVTIRTGEGM
jgi:nitrogen regulatory protein PII 1